MRVVTLAVAILTGIGAPRGAAQATDLKFDVKASDEIGSHSGSLGSCKIDVEISARGGYRVMSSISKSDKKQEIRDVNSYAATSHGSVVYSVGAIYGVPGIYLLNCASGVVQRLVGPRKIDKAYPKGADYFELLGVKGGVIYFYYAPDVDTVDVQAIKSQNNLYETDFCGRSFKKVQ